MAEHTNNSTLKEDESTRTGYHRFLELEGSWFPNNNGDFASSFMNPHGLTNELTHPCKSRQTGGIGFQLIFLF